jgi:hypothetical protein
MIRSSNCPPWRQLDRPGSAGDHDGRAAVTPLPGTRSHYAPNRHDTGSISVRSVDEVALVRGTISHYAPVLIAQNSSRRRPEKIAREARPTFSPGLVLKCKIIGVLEVVQTEGGKHAIRNRLVRPAQGGRQKMTPLDASEVAKLLAKPPTASFARVHWTEHRYGPLLFSCSIRWPVA